PALPVAAGGDRGPDQAQAKPHELPPRLDLAGDPLPPGALARLGSIRFRHAGFVRSVVFSPDGKIVASMGDDHAIRLWEVSTGNEICTCPGHSVAIYALAFSPDGQTLAAACYGGEVPMWQVASGKEIHRFRTGHGGEVVSVAFSPDGKMIAAGSPNKFAYLW